MEERMTYSEWMDEVDLHVGYIAGFSVHDLADQPSLEQYQSGLEPLDAAKNALASEGFPGFEEVW